MRSDLRDSLVNLLDGAHRIAVLGIGSEIRGDDRVGLFAARLLQRRVGNSERVRAFYGATAPENLVGEIKRYRPSHLLLIDAGDTDAPAGTVEIIPLKSLSGLSASTHSLPMNVLADYMRNSIACEVSLIGIQPKRLGIGEALTPEVAEAARAVIETLVEIVTNPQRADVT